MELKHVIAQLVFATAALGTVGWAVREAQRDWAIKRIPLTRHTLGARGLGVVVLALVVLALTLYGLIALELIPVGHPLALFGLLAWMSAIMIGGIIGGITLQLRRAAKGWLTIVGENVIEVEAPEGSARLELRARSVTLRFAAGAPQNVQFELRDGDQVAHLWGGVAPRHMRLVTEGPPVLPRGLIISSSVLQLCEWLTPFVDRAQSAPGR